MSAQLAAFLQAQNIYESEEELAHREAMLRELRAVLNEWMADECQRKVCTRL